MTQHPVSSGYLIYEGLSRVAADGVMACASTIGRSVFFTITRVAAADLRDYRSSLRQALTLGRLARQKKRLDQLTFPADGHAGEPFVPLTLGHLGFRVEPLCEQLELRCRNLTALDAVEKMLEESGWQALAADLRHAVSDTVEAARQPFFDSRRLD